MKLRVVLSLLIVFLSVLTCMSAGQEDVAAPAVATPTPVSEAPVVQEEESSRQLRIFREALQQGSTEVIRVEAAFELLLRSNNTSWDILVTTLKTPGNAPARVAVCKALIKSRGLGQAIGSRRVFLEPLMEMLASSPSEQATIAAEALLLFDYSDIEAGLTGLLKDSQASRQSRMNAVYAMQIRPEPQALRSLIQILGDPDGEVSKTAEIALQEAFGIPVGTSRKVWSDILDELKQKTPDDIRRERLLRQEMKLREIQTERDRWQRLYLSSLDRQYELSDETGRAKMTLEMLSSDLPAIRIWALGRVAQYQATDKAPLRDKLFSLLSDPSRDVRLQTAKVLNNMSVLNPAQKLLERFKVENDPEVALAMFEALGEACFFAFSPGSEIVLSPEIKSETLDVAVQYLLREQTETARKGADVIRKILELNNLSKESMGYYLDIINQRYRQTVGKNPTLQADLLSVMAHLSGQGLTRSQASKLYEDAFVQGMATTDNAALRLAGIRGMMHIDPVKAFSMAKRNQLMRDESSAVRLLVIELAGTVGAGSDLDWLVGMMNSNGHLEQVWASIKSICQRQKSPFMLEWVPRLEQAAVRGDYVREMLELAEQKAAVEQDAAVLAGVRGRLIGWYASQNAWEQGYAYLEKIGYAAEQNSYADDVTASIFDVYLFSGDFDKLSQVVAMELTKNDFDDSLPVYRHLQTYLSDPAIPEEVKRAILDKFAIFKVENRPEWQAFMRDWDDVYGVRGASSAPAAVSASPSSGEK